MNLERSAQWVMGFCLTFLASLASPQARAAERLFPTDLPSAKVVEFQAAGFDRPVAGVIYRTEQAPCCGVPLGGLGTGSLDMDAHGVYGFSTLFHPSSDFVWKANARQPSKTPTPEPILGLAVGGKVYVLASPQFLSGQAQPWCTEPYLEGRGADPGTYKRKMAKTRKVEGVEPAQQIHYWGHYPVADMEFETGAPVSVGLRAWAPFLPGDAAAANTPAAVFEVFMRNTTDQPQQGSLAINFPGPADEQEACGESFTRKAIAEDFQGVQVRSDGGVQYVLGVIGPGPVRAGGGLSRQPGSWARLATALPQPTTSDSSASVAVDFSLKPGEEKVVRFLLTWFAPVWQGARTLTPKKKMTQIGQFQVAWLASPWDPGQNDYTPMYAARFRDAVDVARQMTAEHTSLLKRVLAWQNVIQKESSLPAWLREALINNLCSIAQDSVWAMARPPLGDWAFPGGVFAMNESPRGSPDLACIPCDWYGNWPLVYFYPRQVLSTLRCFKQYQRPDGEIPFWLGMGGDLPDLATPAYFWQVSLNGTAWIDMVARLWEATGDMSVLHEFYESAKRCNTFTINLSSKPGKVIRMPDRGGMEWFEHGDWAGMATHVGGLHLAQLRLMERMATAMRDKAYARQCRQWLREGQQALEDRLWAGSSYLNYWEPETGKKSDDIMGYQLDGEWAARIHGLPGVFRPERVKKTLETIRRCNVALAPEVGAVNFTKADGRPCTQAAQPGKEPVAYYGTYAMFCAEVPVLGETYMYNGQKEFGLDLVRKHWENLVCRQRLPFDLPNIVSGDDGRRLFGTNYYQCMMLWTLPAAIEGQDLRTFCAPQGLASRIVKAVR